MNELDFASVLPPHTPREHVLMNLLGVVFDDQPNLIRPVAEDRFLKNMEEDGLTRDDALPLVRDLMGEGLIERDWPGELTGDMVSWRLTEAGLEMEESARRQRYQVALQTLGTIEQRHEHVIKGADRSKRSQEIVEAWATLCEGWDIVETVAELSRVELLSTYSVKSFVHYGHGKLDLGSYGMWLVRDKGWSRYAKKD